MLHIWCKEVAFDEFAINETESNAVTNDAFVVKIKQNNMRNDVIVTGVRSPLKLRTFDEIDIFYNVLFITFIPLLPIHSLDSSGTSFSCTMSLLVIELVVQFLQNHVSDRNVECILRLYHAMPCVFRYRLPGIFLRKLRERMCDTCVKFSNLSGMWMIDSSYYTEDTCIEFCGNTLVLRDPSRTRFGLPMSVKINSGVETSYSDEYYTLQRVMVIVDGARNYIEKLSKVLRKSKIYCAVIDRGYRAICLGGLRDIVHECAKEMGDEMLLVNTKIICYSSSFVTRIPSPILYDTIVPFGDMISPRLWWIPCRRFLKACLEFENYVSNSPILQQSEKLPWMDFCARFVNLFYSIDLMPIHMRHIDKTLLDFCYREVLPLPKECTATVIAFRILKKWATYNDDCKSNAKKFCLLEPMVTASDPRVRSSCIAYFLRGLSMPEPKAISIFKTTLWFAAAQKGFKHISKGIALSKEEILESSKKVFFNMLVHI